ncbi:MAG: hypothetical protein ACAI38_21030 [Myxococcota bacterium]
MRALLRIFLVALVAAFSAQTAAAADAVLVTAPRGVPAKLGNAFVDTVKKGVAGKVIKGPALKVSKMSDRTQALTQACTAKRTGFAVDAAVEKKRLTVIVISANGDLVFEKAAAYPKAPAKQRAVLLEAARGAAAAIKASAPAPSPTPAPAPTMPATPTEPATTPPADGTATADPFSAGAAPPWMATQPSAPKSAEPLPTTQTQTSSEAAASEPTKSKSKRDGGGRGEFRIAIGALGGGSGYKEHIDTSRDQGDRDVKISLAPHFGGQLELEHAVGFRLTAVVAKQKATLQPDITDPQDIDIDQLMASGRMSLALTDGDLPIAIAIGGGYEKLDATGQPDILWVPSSKLIGTFVGVTLSSGDLTTVGFTFEGGAGIVPWGKHTRTADTVELSSRALGGQGWLRGRYQFPKALGSSAGVFFEAGANLRYLTLSPGSVELPADDGTVRTSSLPVGDEKSNRFDYGLGASIGIMWRPGD